jgi:hypothetical protein
VDISTYRRTYFALVKTLALTDDARHDFNYAQVGKYSTGDFTVSDWLIVVAECQRRAGQNVQPGRPHIRGQQGGTPGGMITPAQLGMIVDLSARITWRVSAENFVRSRLLSPLRRQTWSGRWEDLFRSEATAAITAFKRMARAAQPTT